MKVAIPFVALLVLYLWLRWLRRPGNGGRLGRAIRASDHAAWADALKEAREALQAHCMKNPRMGRETEEWHDELSNLRMRVAILRDCEPKL